MPFLFEEMEDPMWQFLCSVRRPSRYVGGEWGADGHVFTGDENVSICLAFPDVYEVGMSYLGFQLLYGLASGIHGARVERAYCPWIDAEAFMREKKMPLCSLESDSPLSSFDILGFTLQYELTSTNILTMLDLGGVPLRSAQRHAGDPIVAAGGPGALAPEPLAPFIDVFCVGDGELLLPDLLAAHSSHHSDGREGVLQALASMEGFHVPSIRNRRPVRRRVLMDLDGGFSPESMIVPSSGIIHDRAGVEVFRGCTRGCRFCQAGMVSRPVRERSPERVAAISKDLLESSGYEELGLVSLSSCDYTGIEEVVGALAPQLSASHIKLSLPSLRMDGFSVALADQLESLGKGGLTFAPEAGTQRLRDVINKGITESDIENVFEDVFSRGWEKIKLYFMMGLPTETREDLDSIISLARMARDKGRRYSKKTKISVSVAGFVPKPHTPFQWEAQAYMEYLAESGSALKRMARQANISLNYHEPAQTFLEGVFARGDIRLADAIEEAWNRGARFDGWSECFAIGRWMDAFTACGIDPNHYTIRERGITESFPWEVVDTGVSRSFLMAEREKALSGRLTPDCRDGGCSLCGWQDRGCPGCGAVK
ncbi:MAG: TIGR03960 family B12-binding radical SAM protein [Thermovirga sp.]